MTKVIALAGRRIDPEAAPEPRFPPQNVDRVEQLLRKAFQETKPDALVCAAACGADLIALAVAGSLGIRRRIVLPASKKVFRASSVVDRPGRWGEQFDAIVAEAEARGDLVIHDHGGGDEAYRAANLAIFDEAERLHPGAQLEAWLVWNGRPRSAEDITLHFADQAWIRSKPLREFLTQTDATKPFDLADAQQSCFVVMPFGTKPVNDVPIAFDTIYSTLFVPAIENVELPEGGHLRAYRTDRDPSAALIDQVMFQCLEYSRFVLGDITGLNVNVFFELGVRYRSRSSGTALFRQPGQKLPFDIGNVKVFDYDPLTPAVVRDSITAVLHASLKQNRLDSPVRRALNHERSPQVHDLLREGEEALRQLDVGKARAKFSQASALDPTDALIWVRLAILDHGEDRWPQALDEARRATELAPGYAEAWRERGIAENQLWRKRDRTKPAPPDGIDSLRRATQLNPLDFDAFASLGGALRRLEQWPEALEMYRHSLEVSGDNHPYPLLNALKLKARIDGRLELAPQRRALMLAAAKRAEQVKNGYDFPWAYFDLIETYLYLGQSEKALELVPVALTWYPDTDKLKSFHESLSILVDKQIQLTGLAEVVQKLEAELAARANATGQN
jgi:tetratricopeptide (TPR) repeat protein